MRRGFLLAVALVLALAAPAVAQETPETIRILRNGFFYAYQNELLLITRQSFNDPVKFRMGAWAIDSYLAIISGNLLSGDERNPRQDERGFFGIRHNDSHPKHVNAQEFVINLTDPGCSGEDRCQKTRFRLTTDFLEVFGRRVNLDGGGGQSSCVGTAPWHLCQQGDGNLVQYEDVDGTWCARWATSWLAYNGTGFIDRAVLPEVCH